MEGNEEWEDRGGNKRRRGTKSQEINFTCFIHLDLQGAFLLSSTSFNKAPPPQVWNSIMMVAARKKREHKKKVMMMVTIKKEKTMGGGGGVLKN